MFNTNSSRCRPEVFVYNHSVAQGHFTTWRQEKFSRMAASTAILGRDVIPVPNQIVQNELSESESLNERMIAKLTGADFEYFIHGDNTVIGRNSSHGQVDVSIGLSSYVSRKHLQILKDEGRYFLKCLGKNGVFVNGQFQRLGGDPYPLEPNCMIRFPSTNIKLQFSFAKQQGNIETVGSNGRYEDHRIQDNMPTETTVVEEVQIPCIPEEETLPAEPQTVPRISPPITKPFVPVRDVTPTAYINQYTGRHFFSAPPSPTGTISAANSCPASPKADSNHMNITDNLKMAAAYAAKVVQERGENPDMNQGGESPSRDDLKPPYSYAQLIIQAIASSKNKHLTLSGIYAHITKHYPYYRTADKGWQNSIRHNLSLNRYFVKVPRSQDESGKGSFWRIEPASEHKLVEQAWRKRRQRGVPCFRAPIGNISAARSAPASPVHSNPISPSSQPQESPMAQQVPVSHQHTLSQPIERERKPQFFQAQRYSQSQSSPASPVTLSGVVMTTAATVAVNNQPVIASLHQQNPVIINAKQAAGKVIWPLDVTKPQAFTTAPHVMATVPSNGIITSEGVIRATNVTDPQKLSIVMPQQQQVVMVAGQQPVVSLGTIISPANVSLAQMPQGAAVIMKRPFTHQAMAVGEEDAKRAKLGVENSEMGITGSAMMAERN